MFQYSYSGTNSDQKNIFESNWEERIEDFDQLTLKSELISAIFNYYEKPTNIQSLAIKPILSNMNTIVVAPSKTGKTVSFIIGILQRINIYEKKTQALILAPKKNDVDLIFNLFKLFSINMNRLNIFFIKGNNNKDSQIRILQKSPHIIIATPGRICNLIKNNYIRLETLKIICLDHGEKISNDSSSYQEILKLINLQNTQFLMFLNSINQYIINLIQKFMKDSVKIIVNETTPKKFNINHFYVNVPSSQNKFVNLNNIYSQLNISKTVIFANKKETVLSLYKKLQNKIKCICIHSSICKTERITNVHKFMTEDYNILISTDIGEITCLSKVPLVINYDIPSFLEFYIHRIGCKKGIINIVTNEDMAQLDELKRCLQIDIKELQNDFQKIFNETQQDDLKEIRKYINHQNALYKLIESFLLDEDDTDDLSTLIENIIDNEYIINKKDNLQLKLKIISKISENNYFRPGFAIKVEQILDHYLEQIKATFTNIEIFKIFPNCKPILLYLFQKGALKADESILQFVRLKKLYQKKYLFYFYPEFKDLINIEERKNIELLFHENEIDDLDTFFKLRKTNSESYLHNLIRNDLVEEFIEYVNRTNFSLENTRIRPSLFNTFLKISSEYTLIECAAFFGSIQIYQYLRMNNVTLTPSLWINAIHGNNNELIHLLEEDNVAPPSKNYNLCLHTAIECHRNDIALYIIDNLMEEQNIIDYTENYFDDNLYFYSLKYYNFNFFPKDLKYKYIFLYTIKFGYYELLKLYLQYGSVDINEQIILKLMF